MYIKHKYADYISHIITVNVLPEPVRQFECSTPVWTACNTNWSWEKYEYTYKVSKKDIVQLNLDYYRVGSKRYNKLRLTGKQEWEVEVYVYDKWRHKATFTVTVEPPISRIQLENRESSIMQWEKLKIDIINGWWDYKDSKIHDNEIVFVDIDNAEQNTWDISITWKSPWRTSVWIEDKYGQKVKFGITIRDTILRLSHSKLELWWSNEEWVSIHESYQWIKSLKLRDTWIVRAYLGYADDWETKVIKVKPISSGTTILQVIDYEWNKATVEILVWGEGWSGENSSWGGENSDEDGWDNINLDENELNRLIERLFDLENLENLEINQNIDNLQIATALSLRADFERQILIQRDNLKLLPWGKELERRINEVLEKIKNKDIEYQEGLRARLWQIYLSFKENYTRTENNSNFYDTYTAIVEIINFENRIYVMDYWADQNNIYEWERKQEIVVREIADFIWVVNAGVAWTEIVNTVKWAIENDTELIAQADTDLKQALNDIIKEDLNPIVKVKKLEKVFEFVKNGKKARNLAEKLALESARKNLDQWKKIIDRSELWDPNLAWKYHKYRYVHRAQDGTNITVHYHKHYETWEVIDFKIKR